MFGFNIVSLDTKGRLSIPARYRVDLKSQNQKKIVITKDPQYPSLKVYPAKEWDIISSKLKSLHEAVSYTHLTLPTTPYV